MIKADDHRSLQSKRKAISALLPYAVWQERDGQPEILDSILRAARASRMLTFVWYRADQFLSTKLSKASPRTVVLVLPYIIRRDFTDREALIRRWAAIAPAVPYIEEAAQGMVDMLLQLASEDELVRHVPIDLWSWLTRCPPLPPVCQGRYDRTCAPVVDAVRALKDVDVFKSYLLVVWSEWDNLRFNGFYKMHTSIQEDFGGIGMGHHRADLIQRLDHILEQLDRGLEHFKKYDPETDEWDLRIRKDRYQELRETLLKTNMKAVSRASCLIIVHSASYVNFHPGYVVQDPAQRLCAHSLSHVHSLIGGTFSTPTPYFVRASILMSFA